MRIRPVAITLLALAIAAPTVAPRAAHAHGGLPVVWEPILDDGALVGIGGTWGLVTFDSSGRPRWVCEESVQETTLAYGYADGVWVAATRDGLKTSADDGCTWNATTGPMATSSIAGWTRNPSDSNHILATTDEAHTPNAVFETRDGGATWSAVSPTTSQRLRSVAADFATGDFWVTAKGENDVWQVLSGQLGDSDGHTEWHAASPAFENFLDLRVVSPPNARALAFGQRSDHWLALTWSDDTTSELARLDTIPTDGAWDGDAVVFATQQGDLGRIVDGVVTYDGRAACLLDSPIGALRCGTASDPGMFWRADAPESAPVQWVSVIPRACTEEPAHPCAGLWPLAASWFGGDPNAHPPHDEPTGCGGDVPAHSHASLLGALAVLLVTRRRL